MSWWENHLKLIGVGDEGDKNDEEKQVSKRMG